jgi:predicted SprT family Zn-dependent metalloprotease
MPEIKTKVEVIRVEYICNCGGRMRKGEKLYLTNPPKIPYVCIECGAGEMLKDNYPYNEYTEKSNDA